MTRRRRRDRDQPVVRVTTPAQLVASVPLTLGYTPSESLVVICCHEPRGRMGLTMRIDLPPAEAEPQLVAKVEGIVRDQRATRLVMVVYSEEPDGEGRARAELMEMLLDAFADLVVTEAVLVRAGRWFSYVCHRSQCCPPEGRPVDEAAGSPAVQQLTLEKIRMGDGQLPSREALEASIAPPVFLSEEAALQRLDAALGRYTDDVLEQGSTGARATAMRRWRQALAAVEDPRWELTAEEAARLSAALHDKLVRDGVAALWEDDDRRLRRLLEAVARQTPPPYDAPVCTALAWVTYCEGAGALTSIALERALASDPGYAMALMIRQALDSAMPPERMREITRRTREALEDAA